MGLLALQSRTGCKRLWAYAGARGHDKESQLVTGRPTLLPMLVHWANCTSGLASRTGLLGVPSI